MSFRRLKPSSTPAPPPGSITFPSLPSLPHISTGLASLDDVLAPGQPLSSSLLVLTPDSNTAWGKLIQRYWIAQGLLAGQGVVVLGGKGEGEELVGGCMWVKPEAGAVAGGEATGEMSGSDGEELVDQRGEGKGGKRIAWRYGGMSKFKTTVDTQSASAHNFAYNLSLTHNIPQPTLSAIKSSGQLSYLVVAPSRKGKGRSFDGNDELSRVLVELKNLIEEGDYHHSSTSKEPRRALRIALPNLFSPAYGDLTPAQMYRFLHTLRSLLRTSNASALITLPSHLCNDPSLRTRLMHGSDACIELEGFGSDPTLPLMFPQTHGLLHLHSPFTLHSLSPPSSKLSTLVGGGRFNNLAFKLKRKAFVVETMHLDVEGGVGERRTKPVESVVGGKAGEVKEMEEGKLHVHGEGCGHDHGGGELEKAEGGGGGKVRIGVEEEGGGSSGGVRFGGLDEDEEKRKEEKAAAAKPRKSALKKRSVGFVDASKVDPKKLEF